MFPSESVSRAALGEPWGAEMRKQENKREKDEVRGEDKMKCKQMEKMSGGREVRASGVT